MNSPASSAGSPQRGLPSSLLRHLAGWFVAGAIALLPLVITVAIVAWVGDLLSAYIGPGSMTGRLLQRLGLRLVSNEAVAYALGLVGVLAMVLLVGVAVESGAQALMQRLLDGVIHRIPLIGSIYSTSKQVIALFYQNDESAMLGMQSVLCYFGDQAGAGFLALLVSPQRFRVGDRDYQIVIVPTAPVPFGGGLLFVPAEVVHPLELSVEGLISIYVSMGVTAGQFLPPAPAASR